MPAGTPAVRTSCGPPLGLRLRVRLGPKRGQEGFERQRVDDVLLFDPAAAGGLDAVFHVRQIRVVWESVEMTFLRRVRWPCGDGRL